MKIIIRNIKLDQDDLDLLKQKIEKKLATPDFTFEIYRKSIDARKGILFNYQVLVEVDFSKKKIEKLKDVDLYEEKSFTVHIGHLDKSVCVIGAGPAGLFAAYTMASYGQKVHVFERGAAIEQRIKDIEDFLNGTAPLNEESNIQYGEGGAGTFSDGKLTARSKDPRVRWVLNTFVEHGAPKDILYEQKPHIGTDLLRAVIIRMRKHMMEMGVTFHFNTKVEDIEVVDGTLQKIITNTGDYHFDHYVLAIGNSARDTFFMLAEKMKMSNKAFAVGFRIEHPQRLIDQVQYHTDVSTLPPASYQLSYSRQQQRGVYTFCMCPGGHVINASSQQGHLCVNGMSYHARDYENANAAIVCGIGEETYGHRLLDGLRFQITMEQKAYELSGKTYKAPVQRVQDYLVGQKTEQIGAVKPSIRPGYVLSDLNSIYPESINQAIKEGIRYMGKKLKGFDMDDAILTGIETRTSCAVRMDRDEQYRSIGITNLYPIGEGAGYAGGIVSSAIDGIKLAESLLGK